MVEITHKRSGFGDALERRARDLGELPDAHDDALREIERQNAQHNFDLEHRHTVVSKTRKRITVGSVSETYAPLLRMDGEQVANVYRRKAEGD